LSVVAVIMGSVYGRYYKPVVMICCYTGVQPCPVEQGDPVIATSCAITLTVYCEYLLVDNSFENFSLTSLVVVIIAIRRLVKMI